jgi:hypothetical protein
VDIFVIGEDWDNKPHNIAVESYLKSEGKKIIQVLYNPRTSSTRIKQNTIDQSHIKNYIEQANGIVIRRNIEPDHELITSRNALKKTEYAFDSASTSSVCTTATQHPPQILPE